MENVLDRIQSMERIFDALSAHADSGAERLYADDEILKMLIMLKDYYEGGQWLKDFEMDERGLIPKHVKRGVLSEDGVYNLILAYERETHEKKLP